MRNNKQLIESYVNLINSSRFRRASPFKGEREVLFNLVETAYRLNKPLKILKYWSQDKRCKFDVPEIHALKRLCSYLEEICTTYPYGVEFQIVITDSHMRLNGIGCSCETVCYLKSRFEETFSEIKNLKVATASLTSIIEMPCYETLLNLAKTKFNPTKQIIDILTPRAEDYYQGSDSPEVAAQLYYSLCCYESNLISEVFKDHIFLTYNQPMFAGTKHFGAPSCIPAVCINSFEGGINDKPWNISLNDYCSKVAKTSEITEKVFNIL
jgi:hypothetical protein